MKTGPSADKKEAHYVQGRAHMGEPEGAGVIMNWLFDLSGLERREGDVMEACKTIPTRVKFSLS